MASFDIMQENVTFECPECGYEINEKLGSLSLDYDFLCPGCGVEIAFDSIEDEIALKELNDKISNLGGKRP